MPTEYLQKEDASGNYQLEDGSGNVLLESSTIVIQSILSAAGISSSSFVGSLIVSSVLSASGVASAIFTAVAILSTILVSAGIASVALVSSALRTITSVFSVQGISDTALVGAGGPSVPSMPVPGAVPICYVTDGRKANIVPVKTRTVYSIGTVPVYIVPEGPNVMLVREVTAEWPRVEIMVA